MQQIQELANRSPLLAIGLMSGTSGDGVDAALVEIEGAGLDTHVRLRAFFTQPFSDAVRRHILTLAGGDVGGTEAICRLHFLLGQLYAEACLTVCAQAGVSPDAIDFVGSHGQTVYHAPEETESFGHVFRSTLQIGEASVLAEALGCIVVSDFRVRDVAAGGLGAPLVPYTEYLLYRSETETVALQNIGGIGNITLLPRGGTLADTYAFDTGPGNMVMDALAERITNGCLRYDAEGKLAAQGNVREELLAYLMRDPYLCIAPPKTTGRERYGKAYVDALVEKGIACGCSLCDMLATATRFTAESIRVGLERFCKDKPQRLIVGGGGSQNPVLMAQIAACLPHCVVITQEDLGLDSNAKEAVAFAILANETLHGLPNNAPGATGAKHPVVMGKITL